MATNYLPPGVTVEELVSPNVSPILAVPATVAVVGTAQGYMERADQITLQGTAPVALPGLPANAVLVSVTSVTDVLFPGQAPNLDGTYRGVNDYTVVIGAAGNATVTRVLPDAGTGDGEIPDNTLVSVAYRYLPSNYFDAVMLEDLGAITDRFGPAWTNGAISSKLTYASQIALENGARFIICQPLYARDATSGVNAKQTITVTDATSGTFTVTSDGQTTGTIAWNATATVVRDALAALTGIGVGNVLATGGPISTTPVVVEFAGTLAGTPHSLMTTTSSLVGTLPTVAITNLVDGAAPITRKSPVIGTPSDVGSTANSATWADTLVGLRDIDDINIFVPAVGQSTAEQIDDSAWLAISQVFQDHMKFLLTNDQYSVTLLGEDRTSNTSLLATPVAIRTHAGALRARYGGELARQSVIVNTSSFLRSRPDSVGGTISVGGQYMAAAIAGMVAARPTHKGVTGQQVSSFLSVTDTRTKQGKNEDAAAGLMVVEQRGAGVFVRHGLTLDLGAEQYKELSVVRCQHRMIESLIDTVKVKIIGQIIADAQAPFTVRSTIIGVLEALRGDKTIVDYANVQVRQLTLQPTTIEVRFSYLPSFPVNYVTIKFSIDLSTGVDNITAS